VLGGDEGDTVNAGEGNNIVLGDNGALDYTNADSDAADIDEIVSTSTTLGGGIDGITTGAGQDIVIGGRFNDTIGTGNGQNLVIGDSGRIRAALQNAPQLTGLAITLGTVETTEFDDGGVDGITTGTGNDIVLGGDEGDTVNAGEGSNIVLGDDGEIRYTSADTDASDIDEIVSTSTTVGGGADIVTTGAGQDIVIGGRFGDQVNAGDGMNLVIGDSGRILAATIGAPQLAGLPLTLGTVETTQYADGGADTIVTGTGNDMVLGGAAGDDIRAGDAQDIVHGDNALLNWVLTNGADTLDRIDTLENHVGGADTIRGEGGQDILIGGAYGDRIDGGAERDLILATTWC
jgi:hypothetical protein